MPSRARRRGTVPESDAVGQFLSACRERDIAELRRRISRGVDEGDLPASIVPDSLARFVGAVVQGMAVQARDGAAAEDLLGIVDCAMAAWDGLTRQV